MAEEVDVSALAELVRIRRDEDLLRERLEKMEARKDAVSDVVYRRVKADYETRKATLESEARAPREKAGKEYAKLRLLTTESGKALDDARLAREEVDFRHDLGEFSEEDYGEKKRAAEELQAERQARVDELSRVKGQFLEAFRSEEDLDRAAGPAKAAPPPPKSEPPAPKPGPPAASRKEPEPAPAPSAGAGTVKGALGELSPASPQSEKPAPGPAAATTIMPPPGTPPPAPVAHVAVPPVPPPPVPEARRASVLPPPPDFSPDATVAGPERLPSASPDATALGFSVSVEAPASRHAEPRSATIQMTVARIVVVQDDGQGPEYVLKPEPMSVGRAPESVIRLAFPDVSRQHAMIFPVGEGFKIADRGSPNGLFVNGARVKEHILADGDVIQVGRRKLIFRS